MYLMTCQYFDRMEKNLSHRKVGMYLADFIQYKFDHYFIRGNRSKDTLNHSELCEMVMQT